MRRRSISLAASVSPSLDSFLSTKQVECDLHVYELSKLVGRSMDSLGSDGGHDPLFENRSVPPSCRRRFKSI